VGLKGDISQNRCSRKGLVRVWAEFWFKSVRVEAEKGAKCRAKKRDFGRFSGAFCGLQKIARIWVRWEVERAGNEGTGIREQGTRDQGNEGPRGRGDEGTRD
jgi:hypothetical protein